MMKFLRWLEGKSHSALWVKFIAALVFAVGAGVLSVFVGDIIGEKVRREVLSEDAYFIYAAFVAVFLFSLWPLLVRWIKLVNYWDQQAKIQQRLSPYRQPLLDRIVLD